MTFAGIHDTDHTAMTTSKPLTLATLSALWLVGALAAGCGHGDEAEPNANDFGDNPGVSKAGPTGKADASVQAVFLDFTFSGRLETRDASNPEKTIEDQLLYTVGQLNADKSVGRLDKLELSNVEVSSRAEGSTITYDAELLVAWGQKDDIPESYTLHLPTDMTTEGKQTFVDRYAETCVSYTAHDVSPHTMWYFFRPEDDDCTLDEADTVTTEAEVAVSEVNTTGTYPEYHKVWEDGLLKVTAVFAKDKAGATDRSDPGIAAYDEFVGTVRETLQSPSVEPADTPAEPGVEVPHVTFRSALDDDHDVEIHALLIDNVQNARPEFDDTYARLTRDSDLIAYNGHSGLGRNIRAMADKGDWRQGQYNIVYMDGCDTYAYVDTALADANAAVNPDDDRGTKYLDLVMNAMPAHFRNNPESTMALIRGLMMYDAPRTWERIFERVSPARNILVSGERDNAFVPGMLEEDGEAVGDIDHSWEGMHVDGSLPQGDKTYYETPTLATGTYRFEMSGNGDPDLFVRIGDKPAYNAYDCRPNRHGPKETCEIELPSPAPIHLMVRGGLADAEYELDGSVVY